ncbi:MAG TPA: molybdopterin molybdenumtransferase MoeA, partial [Dehalococcoidia bacterium]|nr:molybdopterin molybdenumtransferase MoeA [Dehalococcoidia bacterium]
MPENPHSHGHGHVDEDMLSVEEAYQRIMASFRTLEAEEKPLLECIGQVLAEDIHSPLALPPLANSGMDGYALRQADIAGASKETPSNLAVIGIVAAGQMPDKEVQAGT